MKQLTLVTGMMVLVIVACGPEGQENNEESGSTGITGNGAYFNLPEKPGELIESMDQNFYVQTVVEGLDIPWGMEFFPEGRILITERQGTLRLVENGELHPDPVSGVPEVHHENQAGLLDIKRHPDYESNGWVYMTYAYAGDAGTHTALARARFDHDAHALTGLEVLFKGEPEEAGGRHVGSRIAFKDGYVYFSTGDRGLMDPAQDSTDHSGAVIRLYDDGRVPDDNPFTDLEDARNEIYTFGHRNPQGMDIHPETGEVWIHEHGPRGGDEINVLEAGGNYGWPLMTHGINYDGTVLTEDSLLPGKVHPIHHWTPSIAPCGMAFVTGNRYPGWKGDLMSGALAGQMVNRTVLNGKEVMHEEKLLENMGRIRNVKMGADDYLYIADESNGVIYRLIPE